MLQKANQTKTTPVDFDLHGMVGVRLVDAAPADVAAVQSQLGLLHGELNREPDIVLRFVETLPLEEPIQYVGLKQTGRAGERFLVLRTNQKAQTRVQIPFEQVGGRCEITCQSGLTSVPLLIPIINLTALANGALPLHASAFVVGETGVLATGWSKGGKTELLLAFMTHGARYVGDDCVYLFDHGRSMCGIPEPVTTWDWHLRQLPQLRRKIAAGHRRRLWLLRQAVGTIRKISANGRPRRLAWPIMNRWLDLIERQRFVQLPPQRAFGPESQARARVDKVFFVISHNSPEIAVEPVDPQEIAERMAFSFAEEQANFMSHYRQFRFAFPDRRNEWIERASDVERERLVDFLNEKEAYVVRHPYPVCFDGLREAVAPFI